MDLEKTPRDHVQGHLLMHDIGIEMQRNKSSNETGKIVQQGTPHELGVQLCLSLDYGCVLGSAWR